MSRADARRGGGTAAAAPSRREADGAALAAALGYAAAWRGRAVVVKVGGGVLRRDDPGTVVGDVALLHEAGVRTVVVHGGGSEVSRMQERLGQATSFVEGLRVTSPEAMKVVEMVLSGKVNKGVVGRLRTAGAPAVGLSGRDGGLLRARPHPDAGKLGRVGEVDRVEPGVIETLLDGGFLPVVSSVGAGPDGAYNLNADTAAAAVAAALRAEKLLLLTDVEGIYEGVESERRLRSELDPAGARALISRGVVSRGMVPKVRACLAALEAGVSSVHIIGVGVAHALLLELFTREGVGTVIRGTGASSSARHAQPPPSTRRAEAPFGAPRRATAEER